MADILPEQKASLGLRQRFLGSAVWTSSSRFVSNLLGLGVTAVLARLLRPDDYGLLAMATVFTGFIQMIQDFGAGQALVQKEEVTVQDQHIAFTLGLLTSAVLTLTVLLLAGLVGELYHDERVVPVLRVIALGFPLSAFAIVPRALLHRHLRMRGEAVTTVVTMLVESAVTLGLAWAGVGVWSLVAGRLAAALATAIGLSIVRPWSVGLRLRDPGGGRFLRFGGGVTVITFLWYAYSNADFFIIGRMLGSEALGIYSMAWKLAKMPWDRLWRAIQPLVLPLFARTRTQGGNLGRALTQITRYTALLTMPAVAGLGAVADDAVLTFLGPRWLAAAAPLEWLSVFSLARGVLVLLPPALRAMGRLRNEAIFEAACVLVLPAAFALGVGWGPQGVAVAWAVLYPLLGAALLVPMTLRYTGLSLKTYLDSVSRPLVATGVMVAVVVAAGAVWPHPGPLRLAVRAGLGAVVYLGLIRLLEGPLTTEVRRLYRDIREGVRG